MGSRVLGVLWFVICWGAELFKAGSGHWRGQADHLAEVAGPAGQGAFALGDDPGECQCGEEVADEHVGCR